MVVYLAILSCWEGPIPYLELFWVGPFEKKNTLYDLQKGHSSHQYLTVHYLHQILSWKTDERGKLLFSISTVMFETTTVNMSTFYFMLKRTLKGTELMSSSKFWNAWEESSPLGASSRHSGVANLVRKRLWAIIKRKFVPPLEFLRCLPQQREEEGLVWSPCRQLWGNAHLRWRRR